MQLKEKLDSPYFSSEADESKCSSAADKLDLYFISDRYPELTEVRFWRSDRGESIHSVRGKVSGNFETHRTFQWSTAVKALVILLVSSKIGSDANAIFNPGFLSGERGSLAASLDYAISKNPAWISEMFGSISGSICYARRLILRTNTEQKRPGPVVLTLNPRVISPHNISVFNNSHKVFETDLLPFFLGLTTSATKYR